jgi:hypothetical protein
MPKVSAGILTFNRKDAVLKAIQSVYDQDWPELEIVVVDSASTDGTADAIRARYPDVTLVRLPRNLGCPGGRNHIYANCTGDYIVNVDDDGFLGAGAIRHVVAAFEADPQVGVVALRLSYTDDPQGGRVIAAQPQEAGLFWGGVSAFRRSMLAQTGLYPEDFFLFAEETYFALRVMDAGYKIVSCPDAVMWHPSVGSSGGTRWDYYRWRNPLLVVARLFPGWLAAKYLCLRSCSYLLASLKRRSFGAYLCAAGGVWCRLPGTLWRRRPVGRAAVEKYFRLRGAGTSG